MAEKITYRQYISEGFGTVNRNWQLILIQFVMSVISCVGFFIIVGVPLLIIILKMGLNVAEISKFKEFLATVENPVELIDQYLGVGIVVLSAILLYAVFAFSLWVYVFGGSASLIGRTLKQEEPAFNFKKFMAEGKRFFWPLMGFTSLIGLVFIAALFVLGVIAGITAAVFAITGLGEAGVGHFLKIFFALTGLLLTLIITFVTMAVMFYGSAVIVLDGTAPLKSLKEAFRYLMALPSSLWLYGLLFAGYVGISLVSILIGGLIQLIPFMGAVLIIPYQLFLYALQGYLNLLLLAVIFAYYLSTTTTTSQSSIPDSGTSGVEAQGQAPPPQA